MSHAYVWWRAWLPDAVLGGAWLVLFFLAERGRFRDTMLVAIPLVVAWGFATLHMPARVDVDDEGVTFARWGRAHHFAWREVGAVHVRRFLVRDRVLVRIAPSSAFRGRYWILDSIDGFDALVRAFEARARR